MDTALHTVGWGGEGPLLSRDGSVRGRSLTRYLVRVFLSVVDDTDGDLME